MNPDQINSLIDVLERSKHSIETNSPYASDLIDKIDIELIILRGMQSGIISPIRDFLSRLRAQKGDEPFSSQLSLVKQAIILEYLTEQIEKLEVNL